jgi:hypothetical protein
MAVVISSSLVLSDAVVINPNNGRLCWRNYVTFGSVSATSETTDSPVTNLTNPSTAFAWEATSTSEQTITITGVGGGGLDYVAFARHNLEGGAEVRLRMGSSGNIATVEDWTAVTQDQQAILFLFTERYPSLIYLDIRNNTEAPKIAVLYAGLSTRLERRIYVGHTPVTYGREVVTVGGHSESGQYLGETVRRETRSTQVQLQNLTPDWYRQVLDPFIAQRPRQPAFFAWRPGTYPAEVGYVWLRGSPQPVNQRPNGMMEITIDFEAIV